MGEKPYSDDLPAVEIGIPPSRVACHPTDILEMFLDEEKLTPIRNFDQSRSAL